MKPRPTVRAVAFAPAAALAVAAAGPAGAQGAPVGPPTGTVAGSAATGLEDIVVTAQRRAEGLQTTPVSVTALTARALEDRQVTGVIDVAAQVPNLTIETVTGVGNAARIFLRGVGEDQAQFNVDPAVGIYVDGVYYARTNGALFDFFDVERVEVLRGPQGTLYGRNTPGGAINVFTRAPSDTLTGRAEILYGRFDQVEGRGTLSGPLVEGKAAASVSLLYRERDGISFAPNLGRDVNRRKLFGLRGSLLLTPTEAFRLRLTYDRTIDNSDAYVPTSIFAGPVPDIFVTQTGTVPAARFRNDGIAANATLELGTVTLGSITAYRDLAQRGRLDNDGERRVISEFAFDTTQWQFSQELTASVETGRLRGIAGLFYFRETNRYNANVLSSPRANPAAPVTSAVDNSFQRTESWAVFGQASYEVVPDVNVTLGGRLTWDDKSFTNVQQRLGVTYAAALKSDAFTPKVGIDWRISPELFAYALYARGYKVGGFNRSPNRIVATTPFGAETVDSTEAGLKTELLDRRARLNLSLFRNRYNDLQLSSFDPATGITRRFNAARATTQGVEAEATIAPAPGLELFGTLSYLDARYDRFVDLVNGVVTDVTFRELKVAPPWRWSAGGAWEVALGGLGSLRLAADVNHRSLIFNDVANTPAIASPALTLVNAQAAFRTADERWTFTVAGRNLTDRRYFATGINIGGLLRGIYPADPRTWSVSARLSF